VQEIAQTQNQTLTEQLNEGVRFLDIRVQEDNDDLEIVHGSLQVGSLMFTSDVLAPVTAWLQANPTETVLMSVQADSQGTGSQDIDTAFWADASKPSIPLNPSSAPYKSYFWQATPAEPVPSTLGEARGKLVIFQSQWDSYGGPADPNFPFAENDPTKANNDIFYPNTNPFNTADLDTLWGTVAGAFQTAVQDIPIQPGSPNVPSTFTRNYLTASDPTAIFDSPFNYSLPNFMATGNTVNLGFSWPETVDEAIADVKDPSLLLSESTYQDPQGGMNGRALTYLQNNPGPTGIVMTDFASPALIQEIIDHNGYQTLNLNTDGKLTVFEDPTEGHTVEITGSGSGGVQVALDYGQTVFGLEGTLMQYCPGQVKSIEVLGGQFGDSITTLNLTAWGNLGGTIDVGGQGSDTTLWTSQSDSTWFNQGVGSGWVVDSGVTISFSGVTNEIGGGADIFCFDGGSVPGYVSGSGTGGAILYYGNTPGAVDVNLPTQTASDIGSPFKNITNIIGNGNTGSTITVPEGTCTISGPDVESVSGISFSSFPNVVASSGPDDFVFEPGGSVSGNLEGAPGFSSVLDYSHWTDPVAVYLQTDEASGVGGTFSNISNFLGGSSSGNTINGLAGTVMITGPNAGLDDGETFSRFGNLVGATGSNQFVFGPGGSISGNLEGAPGFSNVLDYSALVGVADVNLITQTASDIGGTFSNISNFIGNGNTGSTITGPGGSWAITGPDVESVSGVLFFSSFPNVVGGSGPDDFVFGPGGSVSGNLEGAPGFSNVLDYSQRSDRVNVVPQSGEASAIGGTFSNISSFIGSSNSYNTIYGPDATWTITGPNAESVDGETFSSFGNLVGVTGSNQFVFEPGGSVSGSIDGGGSTSTLDYSALTGGATVNLATDTASDIGGTFIRINKFIGSSSNNTLFLRPQATCDITGSNTSAIYSQTFTAFENLVGAANDQFVFNPGGDNVVSYRNLSTAVTVNLAASTSSGIGGTFSGISTFFGGMLAGTVVGPNSATSWAIPQVNTINVLDLTFSNFANISAGSGNDSFALSGAGELTGNIDGGGGVNSLSYSGYPGNVIVDLLLDSATAVLGGVHDIQNVTGGNGNNLLVGNAHANVLVGGSGRNILIGEGGGASLTGGGGDNLLIGGSTVWDGNMTALQRSSRSGISPT
jgi:hypothetical protein